MITVGIGRIILDGRHVAGFRYTLGDARIAARLNTEGFNAKLYAGKSEGRVLDLARQLVRMRTNLYLFGVSAHTLGVTCELARQLAQLRPDAHLVFHGDCSGANPAQLEAMAALGTMAGTDPVATLLGMNSPALAAPSPSPELSPYLAGILHANDIVRLGLSADQPAESFAHELSWLAANMPAGKPVIPLLAQELDAAAVHGAVLQLGTAGIDADFHLHLEAAACTEALYGLLARARITRLIVNGDPGALPPVYERAMLAAAEGEDARTARAAVYGRNGNVALHTGFYFDAKQTPGIYHLEVPLTLSPPQRMQVYEWAATGMDIRSAAVLKGGQLAIDEKLPDFAAPGSRETGGWPKHAYAIGADGDDASITFDGETSTRQQMRYVPLSRLDATALASQAVTFVTMKGAEDAVELVRRLDAFHVKGEISLHHPKFPVFFENGCRWMGYGTCRLPLVRRLEVNPAMELSSCRDAGSVGTLADSYDQIVIRVKQQQQMEEVRRECSACPVRDKCSHCSQLPGEWGGRYCEIRRKYQHSPLYLELHSILPMLATALDGSQEAMLTMKVSYSGLPSQHYIGAGGVHKDGARPVILSVLDQHIAWWRGSRRLSRLSAPLALMAEAWWQGAAEDDIGAALGTAFGVSQEVARSSLADGMRLLAGQGVIHA